MSLKLHLRPDTVCLWTDLVKSDRPATPRKPPHSPWPRIISPARVQHLRNRRPERQSALSHGIPCHPTGSHTSPVLSIVANRRAVVKHFDQRCTAALLGGIVHRHLITECTFGFGVFVALFDVLRYDRTSKR